MSERSEKIGTVIEDLVTNLVGEIAQTVMTDEDGLADRIRDEISQIDWSEEIDFEEKIEEVLDGRTIRSEDVEGIEDAVEEAVTETRAFQDLSDRIDELEGTEGFDSDDLPDHLERLLDSVPEDEDGRCSLGDSFTAAVRKVLRDDQTLQELADALFPDGVSPVVKDVEPEVEVTALHETAVVTPIEEPIVTAVPNETGHLFDALRANGEVWSLVRGAAIMAKDSAIGQDDAAMSLGQRLEALVRGWQHDGLRGEYVDPGRIGILLRAGSLHRVDWTVLAREVLRAAGLAL